MKIEHKITDWKFVEPSPESVLVMVGLSEGNPPGVRRVHLQQFKTVKYGKRYVDGQFISNWIQYLD